MDALRQRDDAVEQALAGLTLRSVTTTNPTPEAVVRSCPGTVTADGRDKLHFRVSLSP